MKAYNKLCKLKRLKELAEIKLQPIEIDTCVCCGVYVPEGRQACVKCEREVEEIINE